MRVIGNLSGRSVAVDLPHLSFATAIVAWCIWYGFDAWYAQRTVTNLILIVPATIGMVIVYLVVAVGCFHIFAPSEPPPATDRKPLEPGMGVKIAGTMALLAAFVIAAPTIGFDVACFLYVEGMLLFLGERRIIVLILVPLLFCALAIYCFSQLLNTPLPLFFFSEAS
jgi:hypothetical protein